LVFLIENLGEDTMDERKRLDGESGGVREATDTVRRPWHAPAIDVIPLKSAQAGLGSTADAHSTAGTEAC
jgi:hypothetical protein